MAKVRNFGIFENNNKTILLMKSTFTILCIAIFGLSGFSQENDKKYENRIVESSKKICDCLDKIDSAGITSEDKNVEIRDCIEDTIRPYNLLDQLTVASKEIEKDPTKKEINITYNTNEKMYGTPFYFDVERYLMQNCESMQVLVNSHDYIFPNSFSNDPKAIEYYQKGDAFMGKKDYTAAAKAYKNAVETDPIFSFAWDNLGLSYRKLEKYDLALEAYNNSLKLEPNGFMPLQNIPVVYELMEDYDKAIEAYQNITKVYPKNAEADYGMGRIYIFYKNDIPKGLDYMCKAYLKYIETNSPYRVDAESIINHSFTELEKENKTDVFYKILKDNNIEMREQ